MVFTSHSIGIPSITQIRDTYSEFVLFYIDAPKHYYLVKSPQIQPSPIRRGDASPFHVTLKGPKYAHKALLAPSMQ
jgi:hypothetical protein